MVCQRKGGGIRSLRSDREGGKSRQGMVHFDLLSSRFGEFRKTGPESDPFQETEEFDWMGNFFSVCHTG
ncbi:MAG TPA: hypothetical protein DCR97_01030 [Deltaproteobacteria bacterium]|nr:hypothetical protein [Deltaproteobacteria bacterium]